jgi:hypothetical protein
MVEDVAKSHLSGKKILLFKWVSYTHISHQQFIGVFWFLMVLLFVRLGLGSLDRVSIESWSQNLQKVSLTVKKILSWRSRSLNLVLMLPSSPKSLNGDQYLSRFTKSLNFFSILIESSQFVKIFEPEVPQKVLIMSRYLDKSWQISISLDNLNPAKSQLKQSWF